ncbi:MAG: RIP metalloprotease RseP [Verrucomicrobiia bacterium]|jgi:regulator of sigma E protease
MDILKFIFILIEVLVLFNLLIIVHEIGHFLAARWRGLYVDRFGVWFGKPIWQKNIKGVKYSLGCIPAGGFVSIPQMAPMEAIEGKVEENVKNLPPVSPIDKIIVAAAGPLFSFLLAIVFALVLWGVGRPVGESETTRIVGYVLKGSPAEKAGIQPGDEIVNIDGHPVARWSGIGNTVQWLIVSSQGEKIKLTLLRNGVLTNVEAVPYIEETKFYERKGLRELQMLPKETPIIAKLFENSPAALIGLKPNDIVLEANGVKLLSPASLSDIVIANSNRTITLKIKRGDQILTKEVKPVIPQVIAPDEKTAKAIKDEIRPMLGIIWEQGGLVNIDHPNPIEQIRTGVSAMVSTIKVIATPKSDVKLQHLSGPVGIIRIYYRLFESEHGWRLAIWFSVILNINLALLNLIPIPVLDGGHILMSLIELVRKKPINIKILEKIQTACAVLLISYIIYISIFDTSELSPRKRTKIEFKSPVEQVDKPQK